MPDIQDRLVFGWWNTGLSPSGRPRATQPQRETAGSIVAELLQQGPIDCLGLGEVSAEDLDFLGEHLPSHFHFFDDLPAHEKLQFETAAVYNSKTLSLRDHEHISDSHGNRSFRIATRLTFHVLRDDWPLHVFVSHWPSPATPNSGPIRKTIAPRFRQIIDELLLHGKKHFLLMGDFNEEPFHETLELDLLASRHRATAQKGKGYLYNPFWRRLGESISYSFSESAESFAGTCFIPSGFPSVWRTVDQIIISSAFLGDGNWCLNEDLTRVLFPNPIVKRDPKLKIFDHFPVVATLDKYNSLAERL